MLTRKAYPDFLIKHNLESLLEMKITADMLVNAIQHCYDTLDLIDEQLSENQTPKLSETVELANLSSIVGNLIATGIEQHSNSELIKNKPHTYPDLIFNNEKSGVEIKVALETNKPKGHLPKEGYYLTFRYVLTNSEGKYVKGKENRGDTVSIWEVRVGYINEEDFDVSSTDGDSGKTALIKTDVFNSKMKLVYFNPEIVPYKHTQLKPYAGYN